MKLRMLPTLVALALVAGQIACSSSGKKEDPASSAAAGEDADDLDSDEASTASALPESKGGKVDKKYASLAQAVRAGRSKAVSDEAIKILGTNPDDAVALNTLALQHFRANRVGAAKILLTRALEKNKPSAALHNNMGVVLLEEGDQSGAISSFKKALQLDDGHTEALGNLGSIYARGGDYGRAISLLQQSYRANPEQAAVAVNYAIALRGTGKAEEAKQIYETLIKKNSRDVYSHLNLASLLIDHLNKPKDGLALVYKVKFLETERKDVLDRANALEKKAKAAIQ